MAKKTVTPIKEDGNQVLEATINIVIRGRSVVHATVLSKGKVHHVNHELSDGEKFDVSELILTWVPSDTLGS